MGYQGRFKRFFELSRTDPSAWRALDFSSAFDRGSGKITTSSSVGAGRNVEVMADEYPSSSGDQCQMCGTRIVDRFVIQHDGDDAESGLWAVVGSECISHFVDEAFSSKVGSAKRDAKKQRRAFQIEQSEAELLAAVESASRHLARATSEGILPSAAGATLAAGAFVRAAQHLIDAKTALKNKISPGLVTDAIGEALAELARAFEDDDEPELDQHMMSGEIDRLLSGSAFPAALCALGLATAARSDGEVAGRVRAAGRAIMAAGLRGIADGVLGGVVKDAKMARDWARAALRDMGSGYASKISYLASNARSEVAGAVLGDLVAPLVALGAAEFAAVGFAQLASIATSREGIKIVEDQALSLGSVKRGQAGEAPSWTAPFVGEVIARAGSMSGREAMAVVARVAEASPQDTFLLSRMIRGLAATAAEGDDWRAKVDLEKAPRTIMFALARELGRSEAFGEAAARARAEGANAPMATLRSAAAAGELLAARGGERGRLATYGHGRKQHYVGPKWSAFSEAGRTALKAAGFQRNATTDGVYHGDEATAKALVDLLNGEGAGAA